MTVTTCDIITQPSGWKASFSRAMGALFPFGNRTSSSGDASEIKEPDDAASDPLASAEEQALADSLVSDGRYLLALRRQIADLIDPAARQRAIASFEDQMSIVPAGQVVLGAIDELLVEGELDVDSIARVGGEVIAVEPFFLDRYPVTNQQYQRFVASGGYEEIAIWDEEIWPEVFGLVDSTGAPGPRYWKDGTFASGQANHPVVGVNWFEAVAYARWVGKRLPSDAEWVKAGAWPVVPKPGTWLQRRYPWGNTFDHKKANVWGSGPDHPVAVDQFERGLSPGGASQMIGNVWEWTSCGFGRPDDYALTLPVPMKSIRGGAFDTYFESQATCNFQSGENPLSRKHNIGFRLTVGACDIAPQVLNQIGLGTEPSEPVLEHEEVC